MYQRVTANLVGARVRRETLNGENYLVVPTVALTVGVHTGNQGPLLYNTEELSRNPQAWNSRPSVVYHPATDTESGSACDPLIIEKQGVGTIFNASWDGRLKWDTWLNESKLRKVDNRVLEMLNNGEQVEVSTGLWHDLDPTPGEWNGEKYKGVVKNIQPDHIAILPDQVGACSIQKGAGLLQNAQAQVEMGLSLDDIRSQISSLLRADRKSDSPTYCNEYCYVCDVYPKYVVYEATNKTYKIGYKAKNGKVTLDGEPEEVRKVTSYVTANGGRPITSNEDYQGPVKLPQPNASELSDVNRKQQVKKALEEHYSGVMQEGDWGGWTTDIFANYVVWQKDDKLFRLPYTYDDDMVRFDGDPEEVERVTEYRAKRQTPIDGTVSPYSVNKGSNNMAQPVVVKPATKEQIATIHRLADLARTGKLTLNVIHQGAHELIHDPASAGTPHQGPDKSDGQQRTSAGGARKDEVDKMIGGGHAKEEDRTFLMGLPDDHFASVQGFVMKGATQPIVPYTYQGIGDRSTAGGGSTMHNQKPMTQEEYIAQAPPGVREGLMQAVETANREKDNLIKVITANKANKFSPKWLATQPNSFLRGVASLARSQGVQQQPATQQTNNYGGQAAGEVPMFLTDNADPTQNAAGGEDDGVLGLPSVFGDDAEAEVA